MDWSLYRYRHLVENAFARLKQYRAIATQYDKLKRNLESSHTSANIEISHHTHIFVFEIVAMVKKKAFEIIEWLDNLNFFSGHYQNGIFPTAVDKTVFHSFVTAILMYLRPREDLKLLAM